MFDQSAKTPRETLDKSLKRIMFGQCISSIGDSFTALALTWFIVQTGSATQVGINLALRYLPTLTLAPFIGAIVDRVSRKKLLWVSDILRFFIDLILIVVITKGWFSIYIVYGYTVLTAVIRLFYNPSLGAVIQSLSTPGRLMPFGLSP